MNTSVPVLTGKCVRCNKWPPPVDFCMAMMKVYLPGLKSVEGIVADPTNDMQVRQRFDSFLESPQCPQLLKGQMELLKPADKAEGTEG